MGLTESTTYCSSNRKSLKKDDETTYVKVVRRFEDQELLDQLANGVKRGGRGRRKNRRANRMLRRARAELINLKLGTNSKVSSMKREIEELNEYIKEMKRKGERSTPKMKLLEQKNKQLSEMISKSKEHMLFDDKKILELEQYIQDSETKKQNQVLKAFAMPSPGNVAFGEIIMSEGLRGKYEVLGGNDLWGLFFYKVLIVDELYRLREDYKAELRKREEEEKKRIEEMNAPPRIPLAPIPSMEEFGHVDPKAKMKHVWWKPVDSVDLRNSVWAKIGYQNSKIDESALLSEFDQKKKDSPTEEKKQKIRKKKKAKKNISNKDDASSVLSMKRSIEMGIAYSKLKWTFEDIRMRLGENELFEILTPDHHLQLNGLTSEKVSFLLKLLPDKSEASMLRVKKPTSGMPFLSLRLYDELPDVHNRILSIEYWYRFRDIAMDLERSAYYVLKAAEVLEESKAFKKTLRMLRTIGNYLNSGQNSIGQQHGFTMSSLCKFAETKGNSKLSVLDFAMTQLNKFEKMGLELPEETECLSSVLGRGPNYLEKLYGELDNMVTHVERATKKARAELKKSEPKIDNTSAAFVKKFSPWIRNARKQLDRVRKLLRTVLKDKVEDVMNELVPDGKGSFQELMSQITRFSGLFLESRHKMLPDYVPRPRILWTPNKIGRSSPRMLLRKRVESTCLDVASFAGAALAATPDKNESKRRSILRSSEKRRLICLPASTLPGLAQWVLRSKGLSPKKMEEEGSKSAPVEKYLKRKEKSLPEMVQRQIKSDAKKFTTKRAREQEEEETKSRRELFPPPQQQ